VFFNFLISNNSLPSLKKFILEETFRDMAYKFFCRLGTGS
jgi:hypothetical protein